MTAKPFLVAGLLAAPALAQSATIHVPRDHATLSDGLAAAAAGDTVLVAPGRYTELVSVPVGVVLLSSAGPDSTVLVTPSLHQSPLEEKVLEVAEGAERSTVIQGFTFDPAEHHGTGVYCEKASPTIRGNRFLPGFGFAINMRDAAPLVEENEIAGSVTFGILVFASSPEIVRNEFHDCTPRAIEISGAKSKPVIGGRSGQGNRFYSNQLDIVNSSVNDIDATHNDWGWATTAEMESKPWPADIASITDGNDQSKKTRRGRGVVDYRNWVVAEVEAEGDAGTGNRWLLPVLVLVGLALVVVVVVRR